MHDDDDDDLDLVVRLLVICFVVYHFIM